MPRFTIRDLIWLTVIVGLGAALLIQRQERRNDQQAFARWTSEGEREWLNARFESAKGELEQIMAMTHGTGPGMSLDAICSAIERFAEAAEQMPASAETRKKAISTALEHARQLESVTRQKFEHQVEPLMALKRTQYTCAEVEVRLKRVERDVALERSLK